MKVAGGYRPERTIFTEDKKKSENDIFRRSDPKSRSNMIGKMCDSENRHEKGHLAMSMSRRLLQSLYFGTSGSRMSPTSSFHT